MLGFWAQDFDTRSDIAFFFVIDAATGALLADLVVADPDEVPLYRWASQEAEFLSTVVRVRDGVEYILLNVDGDWTEVNVRTGERTVVTDSYANNCDSAMVAVDWDTLQAYGHAEGGCFGTYAEEAIFTCGLLYVPNDGVVDDSGEGN